MLLSYAPAGKMEAFFNAWEQLGFTPGGYSQDKGAPTAWSDAVPRSRYEGLAPFGMSLRCVASARPTGAGEGIRTLDPNLGKVVLYP